MLGEFFNSQGSFHISQGEHDDSVYIFDENSHEIPFDPDFRDISELFTDLQDVFDRVEEPLTRHSSTDDEQVGVNILIYS